MKSDIELDRRKVLGTVGSLAIAGSGLAAISNTAAAVNTTLNVTGSSITTDDGTIDNATVSVDSKGDYDGLDTEANYAEFSLHTRSPANGWEEMARSDSHSVSDEGSMGVYAGNTDDSFEKVSLLSNSGWTASDFADETEDGNYEKTEVEFALKFQVFDEQGNEIEAATASDTAIYEVKNQPSDANAQGDGSTGMSGTNQEP